MIRVRGTRIWPLDREAAKLSMLLSTGFGKRLTRPGGDGVIGSISFGDRLVTCPTGHQEEGEDVVTGQAIHPDLDQHGHVWPMHADQDVDQGSDTKEV